MKLRLNRYLLDKDCTMGKFYINDTLICDTLENPYRGDNLTNTKIYGKTAIPCGTYEVKMTYSPKFKMYLPEILRVPFFTGIRIHSGNTVEDTDGCPIVGRKERVGLVSNSRDNLRYIIDSLKAAQSDKVMIDVRIGFY